MVGDIRYIKTKEAAALLGLSHRTLETYRWRGGGPPYFLFGSSVRYLRSRVLAWAAARGVRSTSDELPQDPEPDGEGEEDDGDGEKNTR